MGTDAPTPIVIPVDCAPKKAPCPKCGKKGRRKRILTRRVRTVAYKAIAVREVTYGEYAARCGCCVAILGIPGSGFPQPSPFSLFCTKIPPTLRRPSAPIPTSQRLLFPGNY